MRGDETLISNPANPVTGTFARSFKKVAPSVRFGWGHIVPRSAKRWSIPFEIGLVYSPEPQLQADLQKELDQLKLFMEPSLLVMTPG